MHPAVVKLFSELKGTNIYSLKLPDHYTTIEGRGLTRTLFVDGVAVPKDKIIEANTALSSENFQWGCSGLFIPQLLSSYAILYGITPDKSLAEQFTNVLDVSLLAQLPANFKVVFYIKELLTAVLSVSEVNEETVQAAARSTFRTFETLQDPNAPIFDWSESGASSIGATVERK